MAGKLTDWGLGGDGPECKSGQTIAYEPSSHASKLWDTLACLACEQCLALGQPHEDRGAILLVLRA